MNSYTNIYDAKRDALHFAGTVQQMTKDYGTMAIPEIETACQLLALALEAIRHFELNQ